MSSHSPNDDVRKELEEVSPLLARLREQEAEKASEQIDMDTLHALGKAALRAVPVQKIEEDSPLPSMRVVHRKRNWLGLAAAAIALMLGSLISYSVYTSGEGAETNYANTNTALSAELIANYEEQTADPIAFLLDDEMLFDEEDDLYFSPAEDVLLDWADDGNVDEELSEEVMFDAIW